MNDGKLLSRLRKRWKVFVLLGFVWLLFMFPIPFLPLMGLPFDPTSIQVLLITTAILTIPFTFLAIFMNDGSHKGDRNNA